MSDYGKRITTDTISDGEVVNTRVEREDSILILDKGNLVRELLAAAKIIQDGQASKVSMELYGEDHEVIRITKRWTVK